MINRISSEPWFGKKRAEWGIRPINGAGYLVSLIFLVVIVGLIVMTYINPQDVLEIEIAIVGSVLALLITVLLTSDDKIHRF